MNNAIRKDTDYLKLERAYNKAQQMQKIGMDNEDIRKNTDWFQDKNGDWKFEFSDKDIALVNQDAEMQLGDIGVFVINGNAFIKELGEKELISHNKNFKNRYKSNKKK